MSRENVEIESQLMVRAKRAAIALFAAFVLAGTVAAIASATAYRAEHEPGCTPSSWGRRGITRPNGGATFACRAAMG